VSEFELIKRFFADRAAHLSGLKHVKLGIGDDCALLAPNTAELAISTDMLVAGRHFFADVDPGSLGHKALAVNLSDLAAMGAQPLGFTLALALPKVDTAWLAAFSDGMFGVAEHHQCPLIGGDTTSGPLTISITVFGAVAPDEALRRDRARVGDDVWVSGTLGAAALAVAVRKRGGTPTAHCARRLDWPEARVQLGIRLRGIARAALDVSDGLVGDLQHVCERSGLAMNLFWPMLPLDPELNVLLEPARQRYALGGGDDYELAFTAPKTARSQIAELANSLELALTRVGECIPARTDATNAIAVLDEHGLAVQFERGGFDHFAD
jgi:thiamine-monophosphate kinase